jgi:hypothetical protein
VLGVLVTFHIVCLGWVFFRAETLDLALAYLAGLGDWSQPARYLQPFPVLLVAGALLAHFLPSGWVSGTARRLEGCGPVLLGLLLGFGILLIESFAPAGVDDATAASAIGAAEADPGDLLDSTRAVRDELTFTE